MLIKPYFIFSVLISMSISTYAQNSDLIINEILKSNASTNLNSNYMFKTEKDFLSIFSGESKLIVDPLAGGRIISFKYKNYDFLTGKEIHPENYGSTFWPSPQSIWSWPPPLVLDKKNYQVESGKKLIKIASGIDSITGLQFIKEFYFNNNIHLDLTYSIINSTQEIKKTAPWEISRVHKGGLFFFPLGETPIQKKSFEHAGLEIIDGIVWYKDEIKKPENHKLSFTDGSDGWMAYAINNKIFIKKFEDIKPENQAPGEGEVLLYISAEADYIEIEVQGKYEEIHPGDKSTWNIEWIASEIPSGVKIEKGSKELLKFVGTILK